MSNIQILKKTLATDSVKNRFQEILGKKSAGFMTSIINVVNSSKSLQNCEPMTILGAAAVAAALDLPIDQNLGFAAIVPYKSTATFQIMYKGIIQLCLRSGQFKTIHATEIYVDELKCFNPITNEITFENPENYKFRYAKNNEKNIIGYYAFFELINGFRKELYWTAAQVENHANKFSAAYKYDKKKNIKESYWSKDFAAMGCKTVLKMLLSKWGIMTVDIQNAMKYDQATIVGDNLETAEVFYNDNPQTAETETAADFLRDDESGK